MTKYRVIAGSVSGASNKVFYEFQIVDESALGGKERCEELVEKGFLEKVKDVKSSAKDKDAEAKEDVEDKSSSEDKEEVKSAPKKKKRSSKK